MEQETLSTNILKSLEELIVNMKDLDKENIQEKLDLLSADFEGQIDRFDHDEIKFKLYVYFIEEYISKKDLNENIEFSNIFKDDLIKIRELIEEQSVRLNILDNNTTKFYEDFLADIRYKLKMYQLGTIYLVKDCVEDINNLISMVEDLKTKYDNLCNDYWSEEIDYINKWFMNKYLYIDTYTTFASFNVLIEKRAHELWNMKYKKLPKRIMDDFYEKCTKRSIDIFEKIQSQIDRFVCDKNVMKRTYNEILNEIIKPDNVKDIMEYYSQKYIHDVDLRTCKNVKTSNFRFNEVFKVNTKNKEKNSLKIFDHILHIARYVMCYEENYSYFLIYVHNMYSDNDVIITTNDTVNITDLHLDDEKILEKVNIPTDHNINSEIITKPGIMDLYLRYVQHYYENNRYGVEQFLIEEHNKHSSHTVKYVILKIDEYFCQHPLFNMTKYHYDNSQITVAMSESAFMELITSLINDYRRMNNFLMLTIEQFKERLLCEECELKISSWHSVELSEKPTHTYIFSCNDMFTKVFIERSLLM